MSATSASAAGTPIVAHARRLLAALRSREAAAREGARRSLAFAADEATEREHAALRATLVRMLVGALRPSDHQIVRWLLDQEIAAHEAAGCGASETLYVLVAAVARNVDPGDAMLLWRAHEATPATRDGVDVEQLMRAGVERVRRSLTRRLREGGPQVDATAQALAWLDSGVASGAADELPAYFAWSDERFGIHIDCPTCRFSAPLAGIPAE